MKRSRAAVAAWTGLSVIALVAAGITPATAAPPAPDVSALTETGPLQPTWLSMPQSRVVVNPYEILSSDTPLEQSTSSALPLNAGYFVNDKAYTLDDMLMIDQVPSGTAPGTTSPQVGLTEPFDSIGSWIESPYAEASTAGSRLHLRTPNTSGIHYGYVSREVTLNLNSFPVLRISVPSVTDRWGLKVNDGGADILLQDSVSTAGTFEYNVAAKTGWSGTKTFTIRIFAVGYNSPIVVDDLRMQNGRTPTTSWRDDLRYVDTWVPGNYTTKASVAGGRMSVKTPNTTGTHYGYVTKEVTVDLAKYPILRISVPSVSSQWGLKVTDNPSATDIVLQGNTSKAGTFEYDVASTTGWTGSKTFSIRIFAVGYNSPVVIDEVQMQTPSTPSLGFHDDFFGVNVDPGWSVTAQGGMVLDNGSLKLSQPASGNNHYAIASRPMTLDLTKHHTLTVGVVSATHDWGLKVNTGSGTDIIVRNTNRNIGQFEFDLRDFLPTSANGTAFTVKLFSTGHGSTTVFDHLSVRGDVPAWAAHATGVTSQWAPHKRSMTGSFASGLQVTTTDVFANASAVTRIVDLAGASSAIVRLSGSYRGQAGYNASTRTVTVDAAGFTYSLSLPALSSELRYYPNRAALERGGPWSLAPFPGGGFWAANLDRTAAGSQTSVGVGFKADADSGSGSASLAQSAAAASLRSTVVATRAAAWNTFLAKVPRPENTAITTISALGVTAAQNERTYYQAWTSLLANVLPPTPETGHAFPILATGKPALYTHGSAKAAASASWDGAVGLQYLAYVEPDLAWSIFEGAMNLVKMPEGTLTGEYLPAREAQTAWILYRLTGNLTKLTAVYPRVKALVMYKQDHPKYSGETDDGVKDIAFTSSALMDGQYAKKIATELGLTSDATTWQTRHNTLLANTLAWFWATPASAPVQKYDSTPPSGTDPRTPGKVISTTSALIVPGITGSQAAGLIARFNTVYNASRTFAGFGIENWYDVGSTHNVNNDVRHPIMSNTYLGLLERGEVTKADVLINALLRDAVRTGMLSERYEQTVSGTPYPEGQRPSLFGAVQVIEAIWIKNGYRIDRGTPTFTRLPGAEGGLSGIVIEGRTLDIAVSSATGQATLSGTLISSTAGCGTVALAAGQSVELSAACSEAY